ncbi:MAG TPA: type II toxin-antitoxin system VapC family toxin [Patescibacteria group bacterium]|jgi:predicted nucleic acid-binding protein|nr:type II toxin-antitoxin system VapC family toxin [Patescibacteria group bacterium]
MVILDTNIFVYLSKGTLDRRIISDIDIAHASITRLESLGYSNILANELHLMSALFNESYNLALTDSVIDRAIKLRQYMHMSLGDSIIAATALENDIELWTANVNDFQHIEGLKLTNPLKDLR